MDPFSNSPLTSKLNYERDSSGIRRNGDGKTSPYSFSFLTGAVGALRGDLFEEVSSRRHRAFLRRRIRLPLELEQQEDAGGDVNEIDFGPNFWTPWKDIPADRHIIADAAGDTDAIKAGFSELTRIFDDLAERETAEEEQDQPFDFDAILGPKDLRPEDFFPVLCPIPEEPLEDDFEKISPYIHLPDSLKSPAQSSLEKKVQKLVDNMFDLDGKLKRLQILEVEDFLQLPDAAELAKEQEPIFSDLDTPELVRDWDDENLNFFQLECPYDLRQAKLDLRQAWSDVLAEYNEYEFNRLQERETRRLEGINVVRHLLYDLIDEVADGCPNLPHEKTLQNDEQLEAVRILEQSSEDLAPDAVQHEWEQQGQQERVQQEQQDRVQKEQEQQILMRHIRDELLYIPNQTFYPWRHLRDSSEVPTESGDYLADFSPSLDADDEQNTSPAMTTTVPSYTKSPDYLEETSPLMESQSKKPLLQTTILDWVRSSSGKSRKSSQQPTPMMTPASGYNSGSEYLQPYFSPSPTIARLDSSPPAFFSPVQGQEQEAEEERFSVYFPDQEQQQPELQLSNFSQYPSACSPSVMADQFPYFPKLQAQQYCSPEPEKPSFAASEEAVRRESTPQEQFPRFPSRQFSDPPSEVNWVSHVAPVRQDKNRGRKALLPSFSSNPSPLLNTLETQPQVTPVRSKMKLRITKKKVVLDLMMPGVP